MNQQKSLSNFTSTSFAQAIALACQLVIIKVLTSHLSLAEFGLYSLIIVVPSLVLPLIFSEIISGMCRYFFEDDKYKLYFNALAYLILAFIVLILFLFLFKDFILGLLIQFDIKTNNKTLLLALISHFFIYLHSMSSSFFKINYQPKQLIIQSILLYIPKALFLYFFINQFDDKIYGAFFLFAITHSISFVLSSISIIVKSKLKIQVHLIRKLLNYSFWLIPGSYFGTIISSSDRILIKVMTNLSNVGIYSIGYKIGDLIRQFFIVSFVSVLGPIKYNSKINSDQYSAKMNNLLVIYISMGLTLALFANSFSNLIIILIANKEFLAANYVIPFILLAHLIWGLNDFLNTGYLLSNKTKITSLVLLVGAIINLCLNFTLIPKLGLIGACLSTAISYAISIPISYHYSKKNHPLRFNLKQPTVLIFIFCLLAGIQTYINNSQLDLSHAGLINLAVSFFFMTICYILLTKEQKHNLRQLKSKLLRKND